MPRRRQESRQRPCGPAGPSLLASRLRCGRRPVVRRTGSRVHGVADVVFVVLTLAVFGLLALAVRGVEKL